jgi:imidazole glycerol-phosphate synthase
MITLLDYGAGNVRSIINSLKTIGVSIQMVKTPEDITAASKIIFPGVGAFGTMMEVLNKKNYTKPLLDYLQSGRPFLGICLGMQALLEGSEESPECKGLCFFKGSVKKFKNGLSVPHIGWNGITTQKESILLKT